MTNAKVEFYKVENNVVASSPLSEYTRNPEIENGTIDFWIAELPAGTYQVKVTVGSVSGVASGYVTVLTDDQIAPILNITTPLNVNTTADSITINGSTTLGSKVELWDYSYFLENPRFMKTISKEIIMENNGEFNFDISGLFKGISTFRIIASNDSATTTADVIVTRDPIVEKFIINFEVNGNGSLIAKESGQEKINSGAEISIEDYVTFEATPDEGYKVKRWLVNGNESDNKLNTFSISNAEAIFLEITVTVEFEEKQGDPTGATDAEKVATAKSTIQGLNIVWNTNVQTTVTNANAAIQGATLPQGVNAQATAGTDANLGNVVITISTTTTSDAIVITPITLTSLDFDDNGVDLVFTFTTADSVTITTMDSITLRINGENHVFSSSNDDITVTTGDSIIVTLPHAKSKEPFNGSGPITVDTITLVYREDESYTVDQSISIHLSNLNKSLS